MKGLHLGKRNGRKLIWHPRDPGWEGQDWGESSPGGLRGPELREVFRNPFRVMGMVWNDLEILFGVWRSERMKEML